MNRWWIVPVMAVLLGLAPSMARAQAGADDPGVTVLVVPFGATGAPNLGRIVGDQVSALMDELPGVSVLSFDSLLHQPENSSLSPAPEARCVLAQQLVTAGRARDVDVILCGGVHPLRSGGFEVAVFLISADPFNYHRLPTATVETRDAIGPFVTGQLATWLRDPSAPDAVRVTPGLTPMPRLSDQ